MNKLTTVYVAVLVGTVTANIEENLFTSAVHGDLEGVNNAIGTGANINWLNPNSYYHSWPVAALHVAAQYNHPTIVSALMDAGADIDVQDGVGRTPIWWASQSGSTDAVKMLIDHGADVSIPDEKGSRAIHVAFQYSAVVSALLHAGADKDAQNGRGETPIYWASVSGSTDVVTMLIGSGANIHILAKDGTSALHEAAVNNHPAVMCVLLNAGSDKDLQDDLGKTPIWWATKLGNTNAVSLLIKHGADTNIPNVGGTTPLQMASTEYKASRVLSELQNAGANKDLQDGRDCSIIDSATTTPYYDLFMLTCGVVLFISEALYVVVH